MVNEKKINEAALTNASRAIKLMKEKENLEADWKTISDDIDLAQTKKIETKKNISNINKSINENMKYYYKYKTDLEMLLKRNKRIEVEEHILRFFQTDKINKEFINDEHSYFFGQMCEIDDKALSLYNEIIRICYVIRNKNIQKKKLEESLESLKIYIKRLHKRLEKIEYQIGDCQRKIGLLPNSLKDYYLSVSSLEPKTENAAKMKVKKKA